MMDLHWFTPHQMMISIALTFFYADEDITSNVMNVQEMLNENKQNYHYVVWSTFTWLHNAITEIFSWYFHSYIIYFQID